MCLIEMCHCVDIHNIAVHMATFGVSPSQDPDFGILESRPGSTFLSSRTSLEEVKYAHKVSAAHSTNVM